MCRRYLKKKGRFICLNPLRTEDGYSRSLRDATGLVDLYSRIPTSTQVTCIAAQCIRVHMYVYMCTCTHALCINIA